MSLYSYCVGISYAKCRSTNCYTPIHDRCPECIRLPRIDCFVENACFSFSEAPLELHIGIYDSEIEVGCGEEQLREDHN
jgi:hypothetical protein